MIISRAPLRVSFLGGGSDFPAHFEKHGGTVLATAIDKYVYVTVGPYDSRFHGNSYKLAYSKTEEASRITDIQHPAIRETIRLACPDRELELHHIADLPARTGLGSSSSFVVAMLQALAGFRGQSISPDRLARDAIDIERHVLAEAGGVQDQILAAYGGFNLVHFSHRGDFEVQRVPLSPARLAQIESHCLLLYTGITRNSYDVLAEQSRKTSEGKITQLLCAMAELARQGADYLCSERPILRFGELLHEGWKLKQQVSSLSLPVIDELYGKALALGATGGKLLGAGRGGFLLLWAPPECHAAIVAATNGLAPLRIRVAAPGATIIHTAEENRPTE
jgi:D-glycero-alpha-D-manno-heptose-7-phosphate kinase